MAPVSHFRHLFPSPFLAILTGVLFVLTAQVQAASGLLPSESVSVRSSLQKTTRIVTSKAPLVQIVNPFGDVRLRFGGYASDMEVLALKQNLDGDLQLTVKSSGEADHIEIIPLDKENTPSKSRIDLMVMVPKGKAVKVRTTHGLVEAKGLREAVDIQTISGEVRLNKNKAAVNVYTDSGDINGVLMKDVTETEQIFASKTGAVAIWLAEDDPATVSLATSGDLITHFSLEVKHIPHAEPDKQATAIINGGGNRITLKSRRGNVAVRAYPAAQ